MAADVPVDRTTLAVQLFLDGDSWCAMVGPSLQEGVGVGGFGDTPREALFDLALQADLERWLPTREPA
jgi:hypothetical protein